MTSGEVQKRRSRTARFRETRTSGTSTDVFVTIFERDPLRSGEAVSQGTLDPLSQVRILAPQPLKSVPARARSRRSRRTERTLRLVAANTILRIVGSLIPRR